MYVTTELTFNIYLFKSIIIETLEKRVNIFKVNKKIKVTDVVLMFLLLTLNIFHIGFHWPVFSRKDVIYDSVLIRHNTGQWKTCVLAYFMEWKLNVLLSECVAIKKQLKSNNDDRRKSEYMNKTFAPQQNLLSKLVI